MSKARREYEKALASKEYADLKALLARCRITQDGDNLLVHDGDNLVAEIMHPFGCYDEKADTP